MGCLRRHNDYMNRLFAAPNSGYLGVALVAFIARIVLGGLPLIGGLISFGLMLVILYHLARVAMNMIRTSPGTT